MSALVVVTTTAQARITETWTLRFATLPDGYADMDVSELLEVASDWSVEDTVEDEWDRETVSTEVLEADE